MNPGVMVLVGGLGAAGGWQWRAQLLRVLAARHAGAAAPRPSSERTTVTLGFGIGILLAIPLGEQLVVATAWLSGVTGLDAAVFAPGTVSLAFAAAVGAAAWDLERGLRLVQRLAWVADLVKAPAEPHPALRHALIAVVLPAVLVAGAPLLWQTTTADAPAAIAGVDAAPVTAPVVVPVPAPAPAGPAPACAPATAVGDFGPDRLALAATIAQVGRDMGVPERGQWIALATAMQESSLRNIDYGDRDSLGLFQQRPSQDWGTPAQVTDPVYAATQFYDRLMRVPDWPKLPLWQAAQAVQRSGHPTAYAKWEDQAAEVLTAVTAAATCPAA